MEAIAITPLYLLEQQKNALEMKDKQLAALGMELAQQKIKNMQKDELIKQLGTELAKLKIDVIQLKGGE